MAKPFDSAYLGMGHQLAVNTLKELIGNTITSRQELIKKFLDPRRNVDDECGYPETESITAENYRRLFDREGVANRVVQVFPRESWMIQPSVFESEDMEEETEFEKKWNELGQGIRGKSWLKTEEGSPIWEYLLRADIMSGIGHFAVLLLGIDDGKNLSEPVDGIDEVTGEVSEGARAERKLIYLRVFDESLAQISKFEDDVTSPRYGQPKEYVLHFNDVNGNIKNATGQPQKTETVHWTRCIHVADNLTNSEIFGTPRMLPIFNRIYDLCKLYGGSAEMYWRGAFPGLSIETHPQLGGDVVLDQDELKDIIEEYQNGLQRYLALMGMTAKSLAPQVVDPTPQIDTQIEAICIQLGCPKRIFMGSERGELASSQDDKTWNDRLSDRQRSYVTPRLIAPFVDRLIAIGVLPEPAEGYSVVWPDLNSLSDEEKAKIALARTQALAQYVSGGVESIISPVDYFTRIHDMQESEVLEFVETAEEIALEKQEEEDVRAEEHAVNPVTGMPNEPAVPPGGSF